MVLKRGKAKDPGSVALVPTGNDVANNAMPKKPTPDELKKERKKFVAENIKVRKYAEKNEVITKDHIYDEKLERNYKVVPADCYGNLSFKELSKSTNSKFIRFSDKVTKPEALYKLMIEHWNLEPPTLLLSVTGGAKSFSISPRLKRDFLEGLEKVANTPGAWVISGGTDTGVMKMVGDANRGLEHISVGVVTWGVLANREMLTNADSDGTYSYDIASYLNLPTGLSYLDEHHTHFLLVDDGTVENWGVEIAFRGEFEKYIMEKAKGGTERIPTVLLVLEGGPGTLKTVHNAVSSQTPCVLVKGSGRVTDMLVYAIENADKMVEKGLCKPRYAPLVKIIGELIGDLPPHDKRTKNEVVDELYGLTIDCLHEKSIFTIVDEESGLDTDDAILTALLNDPNTSTSDYDKLRLTLHWDRVDLADKVLSPMNQWKSKGWVKDRDKKEEEAQGKKELERLLIMALAMNKVRFVELLIDFGVSVRSMLTREMLEILYAFNSPSTNHLQSDLYGGKCDRKLVESLNNEDKEFFLSLTGELGWSQGRNLGQQSAGEKVEKLNLEDIKRNWLWNTLDEVPREYLNAVIEIPKEEGGLFKAPYRQLFVWAVFNNYLDMAVYLWQFVQDSMATSLFAFAIAKNMRQLLRSNYRNVQDTEEKALTESLEAYTHLSFDLLETCHKDNEIDTVVMVTKQSKFFDDKCSTLDFAFATGQQEFVAHRGIQDILEDEWGGSIKSKASTFRILATIFLPFIFICGMDIRKRGKRVKAGPVERQPNSNKAKENPVTRFFKKFFYFHTQSPRVRFFEHTIGYVLFLILFAYVAISKKSIKFEWTEIVLIITVIGYVTHEIYQLAHMDAPKLSTKIVKYIFNFWNLFDLLCITLFFVALTLRCFTSTLGVGHLLYSMNVGLWIGRIIHILYADPISGPYVVLIGKMSEDILHFLIILLIFVVSYGVTVRAILETGVNAANVIPAAVYRPYFHLFGELFLEEERDNSTTMFSTPKQNTYAEPIALVYLGAYILIANILLLNLLIAVFNSTYEKVMATASRTWKFQRYQLIVEYAHQRTFCYPPFNLIEHVYCVFRWMKSSCQKKQRNTVLSVRRSTNRNREEEEEALLSLERRSLTKVLRKREEGKSLERGEESGGMSMMRSELEKKFLEQHDNYHSLNEKNNQNVKMMQKDMEKRFKEQEDKLMSLERKLGQQLSSLLEAVNNLQRLTTETSGQEAP